jgi:hypothetical protein
MYRTSWLNIFNRAGACSGRRLSTVSRLIALPHYSHHGLDGEPPTRTIGRVAVKYVDGSWATAAGQPVVRSRVTPLC